MIKTQDLLAMYKKEKNPKKKERLLAIYKIIKENLGIATVARMFLKSYNTVKQWYLRFLERGTDGLDELPRSGRPRKYNYAKITDFIEEKSTSNPLRFPKYLAHKMGSTLGMQCKADSIRNILRKEGYSPKTPQPIHVNKATGGVISYWQHNTRSWISRLKRDGFTLCVIDQTYIKNDIVSRRGPWSKVGQRVFGTYLGSHKISVVSGALFDDGRQMFARQSRFRKEDAVSFIRRILRRYEKVGIILDKAPQHTSNDVKDLLQEYKGRLRLRYFPTGVPELNATEACWNKIKGEPLMYEYYSSIDKRIDAVMEFMRTNRFNYDIRKFLFRNPIAIT